MENQDKERKLELALKLLELTDVSSQLKTVVENACNMLRGTVPPGVENNDIRAAVEDAIKIAQRDSATLYEGFIKAYTDNFEVFELEALHTFYTGSGKTIQQKMAGVHDGIRKAVIGWRESLFKNAQDILLKPN